MIEYVGMRGCFFGPKKVSGCQPNKLFSIFYCNFVLGLSDFTPYFFYLTINNVNFDVIFSETPSTI